MTMQQSLRLTRLVAVAATAILVMIQVQVAMAATPNFTRITTGPHVNDGGVSFGASWIDYDNDGWLDIYVGNAGDGENNFLYHNEGDGSFTKITLEVIVNDGAVTYSHCWGDYDNDGDPDLYVGRWSNLTNYFYTNDGDGTFTKVDTAGDLTTDPGYSTHQAWVDVDNDGDLDLYAQNEHETLPFSQANTMFRNDDGNFVKITTGEIVTDVCNSHGLGWSDYDNDGDMDLFVANAYNNNPGPDPYMELNGLYRNDGNFDFTKIVSGPVATDVAISYGPSWGDYDNDGDQDLYVTNGTFPLVNFLYSNNGDGSFAKITTGEIVTDAAKTYTSSCADYDNDGDLDFFLTTWNESAPQNQLYENSGDGTFTRITDGNIAHDEASYFAAVWGDYDRDGDLDVYLPKPYQPGPGNTNNALYRNEGNGNNWLIVKCVGTISNASAIGAKVRIKANIFGNPVWQLREISPSIGYGQQHAINAHFGLGDAETVDSIKVEWPSGIVTILTDTFPNDYLTIIEGCCEGVTGNVDCEGIVDIGDVTELIQLLFIRVGDPYCCEAEADLDYSGDIDIGDLTILINRLFITVTDPPPCP